MGKTQILLKTVFVVCLGCLNSLGILQIWKTFSGPRIRIYKKEIICEQFKNKL